MCTSDYFQIICAQYYTHRNGTPLNAKYCKLCKPDIAHFSMEGIARQAPAHAHTISTHHEIDQFSWNGYKSNNNDNKMRHKYTTTSRIPSLQCKYWYKPTEIQFEIQNCRRNHRRLVQWMASRAHWQLRSILLCFAGNSCPCSSNVWCPVRMQTFIRSTSISDEIERNTNVAY